MFSERTRGREWEGKRIQRTTQSSATFETPFRRLTELFRNIDIVKSLIIFVVLYYSQIDIKYGFMVFIFCLIILQLIDSQTLWGPFDISRVRESMEPNSENIETNLSNLHVVYPENNPSKLNNALYTAVIIEPRKHKALDFVLSNFMENLDERWNFVIFHGNQNEEYLETILVQPKYKKHWNRIVKIKLNVDNLRIAQYNNLFYEEDFYGYIPTENFLIFQTDTLILSKNKDKIYDFLKYDYVGAPWPEKLNNVRGMHVGNGGLSLRRKTKMMELLKYKTISKEYAKYYDSHYEKYLAEDQFFCGHFFPTAHVNKPSLEEASHFSVEALYYANPFGIHKCWGGLSAKEKDTLMRKYPEIKELELLYTT